MVKKRTEKACHGDEMREAVVAAAEIAVPRSVCGRTVKKLVESCTFMLMLDERLKAHKENEWMQMLKRSPIRKENMVDNRIDG